MSHNAAHDLAERLTRPRRVGLFGRRGVGKTTLLAMLYREAIAGRLPGLRLAAADTRTAEYLGEKVRQLEAGESVPSTVQLTELRFNLYRGDSRVELVLLDYQGDPSGTDRAEPVREFLRSCDAVLVCVDAEGSESALQQERERLIEDHLAQGHQEPHRPLAIIRMKADHTAPDESPQHPLEGTTGDETSFAVSSLRHVGGITQLAPEGLEGPLIWLADALHRLDAARLARLFQTSEDVPLMRRALAAFRKAHPSDPLGPELEPFIRWDRRFWRRVALALGLCAVLLGLLWSYDAYGASVIAAEDARLADDPEAALAAWQSYQRRHPTRQLFGYNDPPRLRAVEFASAAAALAREPDPEARMEQFRTLCAAYPDQEIDTERHFRWQRENDAAREKRGREELEALDRSEANLSGLLEQAKRGVKEYGESPVGMEFAMRAKVFAHRLDSRAYAAASAPGEFAERKQRLLDYLARHPKGEFASRVDGHLARLHREWDAEDYRKVRERWMKDNGAFDDVRTLSRAYLTAHPDGKYRDSIVGLMRWCDRVNESGEYRVTLVSGVFDRKAAFWASRGVSPSVTIEVAGITYGPGPIAVNEYAPRWSFEFPRRIRWKTGDRVRVLVTDHYTWRRTLADLTFDEPAALGRLTDLIDFKNGSVRFESDFRMPDLPGVD